ncbi:DUF1294 domain-containing protein [Cryobacterium sp. BB307]|uniref:DUF1294 domain-containing protein n=1 Tax=Cryobacterium sp. BB307 TaxID=2716317 RepID=UPI001448956D|nr:DUF1294 domain-containing protein [Cryobacterium sp. BB307]
MVSARERVAGSLTSWNDDRGFGFISPTDGGRNVFVHISAFDARVGRPQVGDTMTFTVGNAPDGRVRAERVLVDGAAADRPATRTPSVAPYASAATLIPLVVFAGAYAIAALLMPLPTWIPAAYAIASLLCFVAYWKDKRAAGAGGWRTPESTLLSLGLLGGWPGGLIAQLAFRHKTQKASFRAAFWWTVVLNVAALGTLVWLISEDSIKWI